jgi:hypothetical protein
VEEARETARTTFSNMNTLGLPIQGVVSAVDSANDWVPLFLEKLFKFNNIVSKFAKVNSTYVV